jgi:hypothetical protein
MIMSMITNSLLPRFPSFPIHALTATIGKGDGTNGTIGINTIAVLSISGLNVRLAAMLAPLEYPTAATSSTLNW